MAASSTRFCKGLYRDSYCFFSYLLIYLTVYAFHQARHYVQKRGRGVIAYMEWQEIQKKKNTDIRKKHVATADTYVWNGLGCAPIQHLNFLFFQCRHHNRYSYEYRAAGCTSHQLRQKRGRFVKFILTRGSRTSQGRHLEGKEMQVVGWVCRRVTVCRWKVVRLQSRTITP